jgi:hypothetical protein
MNLYRKTSFKLRERVLFDTNNEQHLRDYAQFVQTNNWKNGCNYLLEDPFHDIPTMINSKVVTHFLEQYTV